MLRCIKGKKNGVLNTRKLNIGRIICHKRTFASDIGIANKKIFQLFSLVTTDETKSVVDLSNIAEVKL